MLETFEQLLHDLRAKGLKEIAPRLDVGHMPTIGTMYEGLSKELITQSLFERFDLHVRSGQIQNSDHTSYSPQLDCMLVVGEGQKLPYSENYVYQPTDVVAVFEVKKTLTQEEIADAFAKFAKVTDLALDEVKQLRPSVDLGPTFRIQKDAFRAVRRQPFPPDASDASLAGLSRDVFQFLAAESYLPLRILLSFGGYSSEDGIRRGFVSSIKTMNDLLAGPSLVMCDDLSIVKATGMPFAPESNSSERWDIYYSQPRLAIRNLLNILWYRLSKLYNKEFLWLTDGRAYRHNVLMSLSRMSDNSTVQVDDYSTVPRRELGQAEEINSEPRLISIEEFVLLRKLLGGDSISVLDEPHFLAELDQGIQVATVAAAQLGCPIRRPVWNTVGDLLQQVARNGLIAQQNDTLALAVSRCVLIVTREGMFAGENRDGRLTRRFGGPGLFPADPVQSSAVTGLQCDSRGVLNRQDAWSRQDWMKLDPLKHSQLIGELDKWVVRSSRLQLTDRARTPTIRVITVSSDEFRICAIRTDERTYELRISDSVELLLRDIIFRWLASPTTCRDIGDASRESDGLLLGQFNTSLFQLQHDVFPYEMRVPRCETRQGYASELLAVAMQLLIAHSMSHVLLGHVDYVSELDSCNIVDESDVPLQVDDAKDRQAMEWSADVAAVRRVCGNRLAPFKTASPKGPTNSRTLDDEVLLLERAVGLITLYPERAWFYTNEDNNRSHQYPQWRFIASLSAVDVFLRDFFSRDRDSLTVTRERAGTDLVEARKSLIWARIDPGIVARLSDPEQKSVCQHWQARTRSLVEPYTYVPLPTCI